MICSFIASIMVIWQALNLFPKQDSAAPKNNLSNLYIPQSHAGTCLFGGQTLFNSLNLECQKFGIYTTQGEVTTHIPESRMAALSPYL